MKIAMIASSILAAALLATSPAPLAQDIQQPQQDPPAIQLDDVVVDAEAAQTAAETFIDSIAAPAPGRKLARWRQPVCVGVGGMQPEASQFMADRISDWAANFGLAIMEPGCRPNILIVATDDGDSTARQLVSSRRRDFRIGTSQSDRGSAALTRFQNSGALVRWWQISMPTDESTGTPIVRIPGGSPFSFPAGDIEKPSDLGDRGTSVTASRLADFSRDDLQRVVVVVDADALTVASLPQITDYIAMVALAQIDPDAAPAKPSILSLFNPDAHQENSLTAWDRAYITALYQTRLSNRSARPDRSSIASLFQLNSDPSDLNN